MTTGAASQSIDDLLDHREWTQKLARSLVWDEAQAEDLTQSVFLAALQRPPKNDRPLRPWLAAVVRNLRSKHARSERRRGLGDAEVALAGGQAPDGSAEGLLHRGEAGGRRGRLVAGLEEPLGHTVVRRSFEERS